MKILSSDEKNEFRKIYKSYGDLVATKGEDHDEVKQNFFKLVNLLYDDPNEIYKWYGKKTEPAKLNLVIDELNRVGHQMMDIEEQILLAGSMLNVDFKKAETYAKNAIYLASGNKKMYESFEADISDYYSSLKTITPPPKKPEHIIEKELFIAIAKNTVNTIANSLMISHLEHRLLHKHEESNSSQKQGPLESQQFPLQLSARLKNAGMFEI